MGLRLKFNVILALTLILGLIASSIIFWQVADRNAREQLHSQIKVLRAQALAVRRYTSEEIKPLLGEQSSVQFLPQTVPSFSAQSAFANFRDRFPNFFYKEAALNPTNPSDKAAPWEEKLIKKLRGDSNLKELVQVRSTPKGEQYTVAFPLTIKSEGCLSCHSTPERAPKSMVALYGDKNGFGWKMNETIGAQIFSVPLSVARQQIWNNLLVLIGSMAVIFLILLVLLNILLSRLVITPVTQMSKIAEAVSMGDNSQDEYTLESSDEIGSLSKSFNRMRRSLDNAMKMLEG
jgi:HAMP domain-containing protein/type II secretory pathway pseudopilin PulG